MLLALLAQTTSPSPGATSPSGGLGSTLIIFLPFAALLFFMMRKQGKQRREHLALVDSIGVGDEIETVAGMYGTVRRTSDDALWIEVAPSVEVKMSRGAVRRKVVRLDQADG